MHHQMTVLRTERLLVRVFPLHDLIRMAIEIFSFSLRCSIHVLMLNRWPFHGFIWMVLMARDPPITILDYFQSRHLSSDACWASHIPYLFWSVNVYMLIGASPCTALKLVHGSIAVLSSWRLKTFVSPDNRYSPSASTFTSLTGESPSSDTSSISIYWYNELCCRNPLQGPDYIGMVVVAPKSATSTFIDMYKSLPYIPLKT